MHWRTCLLLFDYSTTNTSLDPTFSTGIGTGKKHHLRQEMGVGSMLLMERIKRAVDPSNIMNPGKMLDIDIIEEKGGK